MLRCLVTAGIGALISYLALNALLKEQAETLHNVAPEVNAVQDHVIKLAEYYLAKTKVPGGIARGHFELMARAAQRTTIGMGTSMVIQHINGTIYVDRSGWHSVFNWELLRTQFVLGELQRMIRKFERNRRVLPNFEFILNTADCPMWNFTLPAPTFSMLYCKGLWNIPLPQWFHYRDGLFSTWDDQLAEAARISLDPPWNTKSSKAVFMGGLRKRTVQKQGGHIRPIQISTQNWHTFSRGKMWHLAQQHPDLFDVTLSTEGGIPNREAMEKAMDWKEKPFMSMQEQARKYKYAVYIEGNCGWADRLKNLLALGMTVFLQDNVCHEFFLPLLKPWMHYIPVRNDLEDLVERLQWAHAHEEAAREIAMNGAELVHSLLNKSGWRRYFETVIEGYARTWQYEPIPRSNAMIFRKARICPLKADHSCNVDRAYEPISA